MPETAEELCEQPEVRKELERTTSAKKPGEKVKAKPTDKLWFLTHGLLIIGSAVLYYVVGLKLIPFFQQQVAFSQRALIGFALIVAAFAVAKAIRVYVLERIHDAVTRFTLQRILYLVIALFVTVVAISVVSRTWYTALTALGVGSIIVGLAVQTPMKSFIAWIYILVRQPFRVGDRIQIDDATGDVIDVGYLDTTLWEFGGKLLSTDHPTGRVIRFPNEKVLDSIVYNYSWPLFPYIWNEIKFQVAYGADLEFISQTMQRITEEELGEEMLKRVQVFRQLLERTPVDELEVRQHPRVIFRVADNTWLEAIVRYVVPPREAGRIKTRLIKKLLAALNAEPDRVMFPAGPNR
jgi:small-conductance mechanosensitive channel